MDREQNRQIAKKWLDAFNVRHLENLLALYDDNAIHFSPKLRARHPETNGLITGKSALREWWRDAFERLPQLKYEEKTITADHDRVCMEYTRVVPGEASLNVAEILEIKNGRITASRVYHG